MDGLDQSWTGLITVSLNVIGLVIFFSFLRKTMDCGFFFFFFSLTQILFFYSWMIKLYLVTCFSCDNMTYRLGGAILSCINDIHVHN